MQNDRRDRLIELIKKVPYGVSVGATFEQHFCEKVADHLIENDVIFPPCKLRDKVFVIPTKENGLDVITEMKVLGFSISEPNNVANCFRIRGTSALFQPSFEQFGKTVFFTHEEAEKALKENKNE